MYINFTEIVERWGKPKGVVHIGAHLLEEREEYLKHNLTNTIWVEANPHTFNQLMLLDRCDDELFFNQCITDKDDEIHNFNITNNGQSSSILELHKHGEYHPHIFVTDSIEVRSKRMDSLIQENRINIQNYDFLNLDIQGAELLALKSFGDLINYLYRG